MILQYFVMPVTARGQCCIIISGHDLLFTFVLLLLTSPHIIYTHPPLHTDSFPVIIVPQNENSIKDSIISSTEKRPVDYLTEYAPPDISPSILAAALSRIHNTPQNGAYVRSSQPEGTAASRARESTKTLHEQRVQEAVRLQGRLKLLTIANNKSHIPPSNSNINILNAATTNSTAAEKTHPSHTSYENELRAEVSKSMINEFLVAAPPPAAGTDRLQFMTSFESTTKGGGGKTVTIAENNNNNNNGTMGGVEQTQSFPGTPTPATANVPSSKPVAAPNTFTNYSGPSTMNCFGEKVAQEGFQRKDKYAIQVVYCPYGKKAYLTLT